MKLKTIITLLQEFYMPAGVPGASGMGSMTSSDSKLRPVPGGPDDNDAWDDVQDWDGIKEGKGWFLYREQNHSAKRRSLATVYITEGDKPHKMWINIKTHRLRKKGDTSEMHQEKIKKHADKVSRAWMSEAKRLYKEPGYNEMGNKITISWNEAFKQALKSPKVQSFIDNWGEQAVTPRTLDPLSYPDKSKALLPQATESKKTAAIADPVNFTPRI